MPETKPVVIRILAEANNRLAAYIGLCQTEISGFGRIQVIDGHLTVTEIYLLTQEVSVAETEMDFALVAEFMEEADSNGIPLEETRFWWHSHAAFNAYFSATDERTIDEFDTAPWLFSYVGNHAGDSVARLDVFPTAKLPVRLTLPVVLEPIFDPALTAEITSEIQQKVSAKPTSTKKAKVSSA